MGLLFLIRLEDILLKSSEKIYKLFDKLTFENYSKSIFFLQGYFINVDLKLIKNDK